MNLKTIKQAKNLEGKRVVLRVDFNVAFAGNKIKDDYKILSSLPTIIYLLKKNCKIIIISHLGRPKGKADKKYSLKPVIKKINEYLRVKIKFADDCLGKTTEQKISKLKEGEIILLENLRFYKHEKKNDAKFAQKLASYGDIYINDAFGVSHRNDASISAIKRYLPSYMGLLLEKEIKNLNRILKPNKPFVVLMGGSKIGTKAPLVDKLYKKSNNILLGGALANNFLKAAGYEVGKSLVDKDSIKFAKKYKKAKKGRNKIILPLDVLVTQNLKSSLFKVKNIEDVSKKDIILDIGPETILQYSSYIKSAKTLIWNGPMGMFENPLFKHGTMAAARMVAIRSSGQAFGIVGGGETVDALRDTKMLEYVDWVSTGGGAMLSYLGGQKMPGIERV